MEAKLKKAILNLLLESGCMDEVMRETFYTKKEVAERYHVSTQTVDNFEERGQLKAVRFGGLVRYRLSDLVKFEESKS